MIMKSDVVATTAIFGTMLVIEVFCWYVRFAKDIPLAIFGITPIPVLACLCYMFWYQSNTIRTKFLMVAFLFDFIADNLFSFEDVLSYDNGQICVIVGVLCFLIGHICNIIAFSININYHSMLSIPYVIIFSGISFVILSNKTSLIVWGFLLYFISLMIVSWRSFAHFYDNRNRISIMPVIGYFLFIISDSVNSLTRFNIIYFPSLFIEELAILVPYFLAQIFISYFGIKSLNNTKNYDLIND